MEQTHEWNDIEMAVDSGATETVLSEEMTHTIETKPDEARKRGVQYFGEGTAAMWHQREAHHHLLEHQA